MSTSAESLYSKRLAGHGNQLYRGPGWVLFGAVNMLVGLGLFVAWVIVIFEASKGEWYKLPVIGDFAEKQARG